MISCLLNREEVIHESILGFRSPIAIRAQTFQESISVERAIRQE